MDKKAFLIELGKNIVRLREQKGWSQAELARNALKDRQSVERIENGKLNPSAFYMAELAKAMDLPLSSLFDFKY